MIRLPSWAAWSARKSRLSRRPAVVEDDEWARAVPVVLEALHQNRAIGLYRRLGFVPTGRTATHTELRRDP